MKCFLTFIFVYLSLFLICTKYDCYVNSILFCTCLVPHHHFSSLLLELYYGIFYTIFFYYSISSLFCVVT